MADFLEVFSAVESLYADQLKPFGRILRKRLSERRATSGLEAADVDPVALKTICEACEWLTVEPAEGGDFCVLIRGHAPNFVDVYSPHDYYPEAMWSQAAVYFAGLGGARRADMSLPGGRYSCAQALASRALPFLEGRSLGQVCHIVQLAISRRKLLGYFNGTVVPYAKSESKAKERCAERRKPFSLMANGSAPYRRNLATWESVRGCLRDIFASLAGDVGAYHVLVPLSNVKRLFRTRFRLELSETALGHSKLSELLQDPRLANICSVKLQGHGYVVVPQESFMQQLSFPTTVPPPPLSQGAAQQQQSDLSSCQQLLLQHSCDEMQQFGEQFGELMPTFLPDELNTLNVACTGYTSPVASTNTPQWCYSPASQASLYFYSTASGSESTLGSSAYCPGSDSSVPTSPTGTPTMAKWSSLVSTCSSEATAVGRESLSPCRSARSCTSKTASDSGDSSELRRLSVGSTVSRDSGESSPGALARTGSWMQGVNVKNTFIEFKLPKSPRRRSHSVPHCR